MADKWNASMELPPGSDYQARTIGVDVGNSKDGNPMVTLEHETTSPELVEVNGKEIIATGIKGKTYHLLKTFDKGENGEKVLNEEKTAKNKERFETLVRSYGGNPATINWNNPDKKLFLGKLVYVLIDCDEEIQHKNPTAAQLAKDKNHKGDVMVNPLTKKPLVKYWPKYREIFGLVPGSSTVDIKF